MLCDVIQLGSLNITCLETPCHTTGHICYFVESEDKSSRVVFTGKIRQWLFVFHSSYASSFSFFSSLLGLLFLFSFLSLSLWSCIGDTLFVGGCGKFFEGTAQQMHHALIEVLSSLPTDTVCFTFLFLLHTYCAFPSPPQQVYCGHEYSVSNLLFALNVEPTNEALQTKLAWAKVCHSFVCFR